MAFYLERKLYLRHKPHVNAVPIPSSTVVNYTNKIPLKIKLKI